MANVNKVKAQGTIYDIEDTAARSSTITVTSKADGSVELKTPTSTFTVPSITNFGDPSELENDVVSEISNLKSQATVQSQATPDVLERGNINYNSGNNNNNTRSARSIGYLTDNILSVVSDGSMRLVLFAYDKNGAYIGMTNGETELANTDTVADRYSINVNKWRIRYPEYLWRMDAYTTPSEEVSISDACNRITFIVRKSATSNEYDDVLKRIGDASNRLLKFDLYYPFVLGNINQGLLDTSYRSRVISAEMMSFDYDITVYVADGYIFSIHYYSSADFSSFIDWSGWKTDSLVVPANTYFTIMIRKDPEASGRIANLTEYVDAIRFSAKSDTIYKELSEIKKVIEFDPDANMFDKDSAIILNAYISTSGTITQNAANIMTYVKLAANSTYTLKMIKDSTDFVGAFYNQIPYAGLTGGVNKKTFSESLGNIDWMFTTDSSHIYLAFKFHTTSMSHYSVSEVLESISVKKMDVADSYLLQERYLREDEGTPFTILHFSDIHGDAGRLQDIVMYAAKHSSLIDDVICSGDIVPGIYSESMSFWNDISGAEKILTCIGNHDAITSQVDGSIVSMADLSAKFIEPYEANWGSINHITGKTYYFKDYPTAGIRIIVFDCMHPDDTDQIAFIDNALDGALQQNYHVLMINHYPPYPRSLVDCGFTTRLDVLGITPQGFNPVAIYDLVDNFQQSGGNFICHLTGHSHTDFVSTPTDYPNQLTITITCATNSRPQFRYGDQERSGKYANAFNVVGINTTYKTITVKRIGADLDMFLRKREMFSYDYGGHQLLSR